MTNWEDVHADWAGPWPLYGQHHWIADHDAQIVMWLFLDYHGDLFDPGTFFVAFRRWVAGSGNAVDQVGADLVSAAPSWDTDTSWTNGEIVNADPEIVLVLSADDAAALADTAYILTVNAGNWPIPTPDANYPIDSHTIHADRCDVTTQVMVGPPFDDTPAAWQQLVDWSPTPNGVAMWVALSFSDYTNANGWTLSLTEAAGFGATLQGLVDGRRSYLDMVGAEGYTVHVQYPGGEETEILHDERIDWEDGHQPQRIADDLIRDGAVWTKVSVGGYPMAVGTVDDLDGEDQDEWHEQYSH